jgi:hypothetical protein
VILCARHGENEKTGQDAALRFRGIRGGIGSGEGAILIRNSEALGRLRRAEKQNLTICTKERGESRIYTRIARKVLDNCRGEWYLDVKIIKQFKKQRNSKPRQRRTGGL